MIRTHSPRGAALAALVLAGVAAAALAPRVARAQLIDYDARRPSQLVSCDDLRYHGRAEPARECYERIADSADALLRAEASWALGETEDANDQFRVAARVSQRNADTDPAAGARGSYIRVRRARLFIATHQFSDALELLQEAAQRDPKDAQLALAMAEVYAEQFEGQAREMLAAALKLDDTLVAGHLLAARMAIEEGRGEEADKALDRATKLVEQKKLPPLEIYTMRAAFELTRNAQPKSAGRDSGAAAQESEWIQKTLAYNPRYGGVYAALARVEILRRRYREADVLLQKAVDLQPDLWSAHAEMGENRLRLGDIAKAREHLVKAYSGDAYSPSTVNTLRLLDSFADYDFVQQPDLRLQLKKSEAAVMGPYVTQIARRALTEMSKRYGYTPSAPVSIELYPDHDDFAVRTAGLPGLGLLGVTFGSVLAMDSPSGRPPGEFHWGSTLWHELAHVFTLSVTDNKVPRWLSEGISVLEEWRFGPTPGVSVTPDALAALRGDKFLAVDELDQGFIRPQYPGQVQVSYMQAGLVCYFIEQKWGYAQLVDFLKQFTRDTSTRAALETTFKLPAKQFDKQFQDWVRERYAPMLAKSSDWQEQYRAAVEAASKEEWAKAIEPARKAIAIYPEHLGDGSPYLILARSLDKTGQRPAALQALLDYRKTGGWHPDALRLLAQWLDEAKRTDEATEVLLALNYVDPFDQPHHVQLGERLLAQQRGPQALAEYQVLMALGPHDVALAGYGLARALHATGDTAGARRRTLESLEVAPNYQPAQELLLQLVEERRRP